MFAFVFDIYLPLFDATCFEVKLWVFRVWEAEKSTPSSLQAFPLGRKKNAIASKLLLGRFGSSQSYLFHTSCTSWAFPQQEPLCGGAPFRGWCEGCYTRVTLLDITLDFSESKVIYYRIAQQKDIVQRHAWAEKLKYKIYMAGRICHLTVCIFHFWDGRSAQRFLLAQIRVQHGPGAGNVNSYGARVLPDMPSS